MKIDHRNLVKLLGFIDEGNECLIVTEYVPNGTLRAHLDGKTSRAMAFFPQIFFYPELTFKWHIQVIEIQSLVLIGDSGLQLMLLMA